MINRSVPDSSRIQAPADAQVPNDIKSLTKTRLRAQAGSNAPHWRLRSRFVDLPNWSEFQSWANANRIYVAMGRLADVKRDCRRVARELSLDFALHQSNREYEIIDRIHEARETAGA